MMDDGEYGIEKQVPGRRTKAALWITQGMDLYMAAQLLSHSDLKMLTKIYDHTDMETLQGALLSIQRSSGKKEAPAFAGAFILSCLNSIDASWNRRPQSGVVPSAPYQCFPAGKPSVQAAYSWLPLHGCIGNRSEVGASPSASGESSGKSKTPSGLQGSEGVLRWRPPDLGRGLLCVMTCQAGTPRLCGDFPI